MIRSGFQEVGETDRTRRYKMMSEWEEGGEVTKFRGGEFKIEEREA